jgi:hypothetical protein
VPWGMNCSPFCLIATINHHLDTFIKDASTIFPNAKHLESDPIFAEYLKDETYVDDLIQAEDNTEKLIQLAEFAQRALSSVCSDLVKIKSNNPTLHQMYNLDIATDVQYELSAHKVLGTLYNSVFDTLTVCCKKLPGLKSDLVYNRQVALHNQGMFFLSTWFGRSNPFEYSKIGSRFKLENQTLGYSVYSGISNQVASNDKVITEIQ